MGDRYGIGRTGGREEIVDEALGRRSNRQTAHIDHPARPDDETMRVGKPDVTADAAVLDGIENAVHVRPLVANDIDQVCCRGRHDQVDGIARADTEGIEGVEGIAAAHRTGTNVIDRAGITHRRLGAAIRADDGLGCGERRIQGLHHHQHDGDRTVPQRDAARCPRPLYRARRFAICPGVLSNHHETLTKMVPDDAVNFVHDEPRYFRQSLLSAPGATPHTPTKALPRASCIPTHRKNTVRETDASQARLYPPGFPDTERTFIGIFLMPEKSAGAGHWSPSRSSRSSPTGCGKIAQELTAEQQIRRVKTFSKPAVNSFE